MHSANQKPRVSIRSLPRCLQYSILISAVGMLLIGVFSRPIASWLVSTIPELYRYLAELAPSVRQLHESLGSQSPAIATSPDEQTAMLGQAVTVLYGMLSWGGGCVVALAGWSFARAPRTTIPNKTGTERRQKVILVFFFFALLCALAFFATYPLRSDGFLVRAGILRGSLLWWWKVFVLIAASNTGVLALVFCLAVILRSRPEAVTPTNAASKL